MIETIKDRWLLILVLFVFIIFKIPHLHYPFFWDESWSYEPGVKLMYLHGPSLMPNAINTFYSRGHPLLFYAAAAAWMRLFGDSQVSQHSFSLYVSVLLIISMYEVCNKLFNKRVAILSTVIISVQTIFFVQASFVLPEIMVALLVLLTLYYYTTEQFLFAFFSCTALLFTKESGMVLGLVLGIHAFVDLFNKRKSLQIRIRQFLAIFFSGFAIGGFFLLQKHLNGWILFPKHTDLMTWEWGSFFGKIRGCLEVVFFWDNRPQLFLFLLALSFAAAISFRSIKYAAPLFPAALIYIIFENSFPAIPDKLIFTFLLASFLVGGYFFIVSNEYINNAQRKFIYLTFCFIVLYLCFSSVNFMSPRYSITTLVLVIVLTAYYADLMISKFHGGLYYLFACCAVLIGGYGILNDTGVGDTDMGAYDAMTVQEDEVHYLQQHNAYNASIASCSFQDREHLSNPLTGFIDSARVFNNVKDGIDSATEYIMVDNIEPDVRYNTIKNDSSFKVVYKTQKNEAWAEIYKRK